MVELPAYAALVRDLRRPGDRHALFRPAEVRRDLLGPLVRRVKRPRPPDRIVGVGHVGTPGVVKWHLLFGCQLDAVERSDFVEGTGGRAFGRSTIVPADVDDERVVEFALILDLLDNAADLVICIREIRAIDVGLADEEL